jgi:hypothetical protein
LIPLAIVVRESVKVEVRRVSMGVGFTSLTGVAVPDIAGNIIPHKGPVVVSTDEFKCFFVSRVSGGDSVVVQFEDPEFKRVVVRYIYATSVEQSAFNLGALGE